MTTAHRTRGRLSGDSPHKQASTVRVVDVPARGGVIAHQQYVVTTACGQEASTTLVTRRDDLVRCAHCKAATAAGWRPDCRCWCRCRPIACTLTGCRCIVHDHSGVPETRAPGVPAPAATEMGGC